MKNCSESTHELNVSTGRWENGKLSALWRHLLTKDCALMESAPPLLLAHVVRVRKGRSVDSKRKVECTMAKDF